MPDESAQVFVRTGEGVSAAYLNPYSGAILGVRSVAEQQKSLNLTVRRFHKNLGLGVPGGRFVAIVTVLTVFMALSGLVLWWPRKIIRVKTTASWPRINFDLHNMVGLYSSALVLVLSLTGIVISYPQVSNLIKVSTPPILSNQAPCRLRAIRVRCLWTIWRHCPGCGSRQHDQRVDVAKDRQRGDPFRCAVPG